MSIFTVRAGSEDPIDFTLRHDSNGDGVIDAPIDLTGVQRVTLYLKRSDGTVVSFASDAPGPLLVITQAPTGQVQLRPSETTWANTDGYYLGYFVIIDSTGRDIPVAEAEDFSIVVKPKYH